MNHVRGGRDSALRAATALVAFAAAFCAPAGGWPDGRLPGVDFLGDVDMVCGGTFQGPSEGLDREVQWKSSAASIARPQARSCLFLVDSVIKGDLELTGKTVRVLYLSSGPRPPATFIFEVGASKDFPDLAQKLANKRCLLQLLSHEDGTWEIRFGGDSYMLLGAKPEVADWAALSEWQRLEQEFASAILDPDPVVAAYAVASATLQASPAAGPVLTAALRQREAGGPWWLSEMATWGLVSVGDLDALYSLQSTRAGWKAQPERSWPTDLMELGSSSPTAISGLRSRNAVPALVELSQDPAPSIREGAVEAMRGIGGNDTKAALAARLDDEDPWIRYQAVMGLGKGLEPKDVGAKDWKGWLTTASAFDRDPDTYLSNWRNWWQTKGKAKYPSVEAELAKAERFRTERPWAHEAQPAE